MRCEDALNQLNARADGELSRGRRGRARLRTWPNVRSAGPPAEGLQSIDADLRRAFVPRREAAERLAEATLAALGVLTDPFDGHGSPSITPPAAPAPRLGLGADALGHGGRISAGGHGVPPMAAGGRRADPAAIARADRSPGGGLGSGGSSSGHAARVFDLPAGLSDRCDSIVRTGPSARCEMTLDNGNALRLDCNTEVKLHQGEVVEVSHGRLFACSTADAKPIEFQSAGGTIVPKAAAQVALECQPHTARLIVVQGTADVRAGSQAIEVGPDRKVLISQGKVDDPENVRSTAGDLLGQQPAGDRQFGPSGTRRPSQSAVGTSRRGQVVAVVRGRAAPPGRCGRAAAVGLFGVHPRDAERDPAHRRRADRGRRVRVAVDRGVDRAVDRCQRRRAIPRCPRPGAAHRSRSRSQARHLEERLVGHLRKRAREVARLVGRQPRPLPRRAAQSAREDTERLLLSTIALRAGRSRPFEDRRRAEPFDTGAGNQSAIADCVALSRAATARVFRFTVPARRRGGGRRNRDGGSPRRLPAAHGRSRRDRPL